MDVPNYAAERGITRRNRRPGASVIAVVGMQSGDEGKGRIVDLIATQANTVIRFQGGDNAGHTVYAPGLGRFALHMVPSGIFNSKTVCIVGPGCVANPVNLWAEIQDLESRGVSCTNLMIDERAHVVMPWHVAIDEARENTITQQGIIGTTKRGIGPAYEQKASRKAALRWGDMMNMPTQHVTTWINNAIPVVNAWLSAVGSITRFTKDEVLVFIYEQRRNFASRVCDTLPLIRADVLDPAKNVLCEGQLGLMRDADMGTYPYVTSSSPHIGGIAGGAGIPVTRVTRRIGIAKAYMTAVGAGPFPTELPEGNADGDRLSEIGHEFGATTGRRRRCGWLDIPVLLHAAWINDLTEVALTKLDVLDSFEKIQVCVGYKLGDSDEIVTSIPTTATNYENVWPVYETFEGWQQPTTDCRSWDELPEKARRFIEFIEARIGVPITMVSVGPDRDQIILRD